MRILLENHLRGFRFCLVHGKLEFIYLPICPRHYCNITMRGLFPFVCSGFCFVTKFVLLFVLFAQRFCVLDVITHDRTPWKLDRNIPLSQRARRAVRSKRTSERCEWISERMSEWPITRVPILRSPESLRIGTNCIALHRSCMKSAQRTLGTNWYEIDAPID